MFSESHVPGIQTLANESVRFKYLIVGVALTPKERNTTSVQVESIIKITKNASTLQSREKNQVFGSLA